MKTVPISETIDDVFEGRLGKKLSLIEELRIDLGNEGIQCPGVLVVGAQSAGKSSVLERLTSIRFPRAENTCTRVPTIVQLHTDPQIPTAIALVSTNADFSGAKKCLDMKSLEEAILDFSSSITGNGTPIADSPIHIRYTRKQGPVMTLIDLPGITHVDVDDHENFDIHEVTSSMVNKYVMNENMVVLVVIPANDDFGNAEALRIAQLHDKDGERTIGVVSKCDLVPQNSDILEKIRMSRPSDVKLALGFIAVRNKGIGEEEKDIENIESKLFATHDLLKHLEDDERGYSALTKKIVDLQSERVDGFIPEAMELVQKRIRTLQMEVRKFGHNPNTAAEKRMVLTELLCAVQERIGSLIRAQNTPEKKLNISARSMEFCQTFSRSITKQLPDVLSQEFEAMLHVYVKESSGYTLPNFISDSVFRKVICGMLLDTLVQDQTEILICDVEDYMKEAYQIVISSTDYCKKYEKLGSKVSQEIFRLIADAAENTRVATGALISAELSQIFTQNPTYIQTLTEVRANVVALTSVSCMQTVVEKIGKRGQTLNFIDEIEKNAKNCEIDETFLEKWRVVLQSIDKSSERAMKLSIFDLQISIHCYLDVMLKRLFDLVPMVVRDILIYRFHNDFHREVQKSFEADDSLSTILEEKQSVKDKRKKIEKRLELMKCSLRKIRSF